MAHRIDKNILKQYFRSGSRPTQKQFHELIDNCYNDVLSSSVSGYHVQVDFEINKTIASIQRLSGKTLVVPFFERINMIHQRSYHYSIPVFGVGSGYTLDRITLEIALPQSANYRVKDRNKDVNIRQAVTIEGIKIFNGTEEIHSVSPEIKPESSIYELLVSKEAARWQGLGIDIALNYDIKSDIAVSDQLDIAAVSEGFLLHSFGSVECVFLP